MLWVAVSVSFDKPTTKWWGMTSGLLRRLQIEVADRRYRPRAVSASVVDARNIQIMLCLGVSRVSECSRGVVVFQPHMPLTSPC